jgi:23S rRNA G2445 N2-methylase RlmL
MFQLQPSLPRTFSFEHWKNHKNAPYLAFKDQLNAGLFPDKRFSLPYRHDMSIMSPALQFLGSDLRDKPIQASISNARSIQHCLDFCKFSRGDFEDVARREAGLHIIDNNGASLNKVMIVTNLPWQTGSSPGLQINTTYNEQVHDIYFRFGKMLRDYPHFEHVFVLCSNPLFVKYSRPSEWIELSSFYHRGVFTQLLKLKPKSASMT